jgi:hypothetical protein
MSPPLRFVSCFLSSFVSFSITSPLVVPKPPLHSETFRVEGIVGELDVVHQCRSSTPVPFRILISCQFDRPVVVEEMKRRTKNAQRHRQLSCHGMTG